MHAARFRPTIPVQPIRNFEKGLPSFTRFGCISCDPEIVMKIVLVIVVVVLVVGSFFADYKWRQWMAARRRDRQ
jgi:hypothetical protein